MLENIKNPPKRVMASSYAEEKLYVDEFIRGA